jgi:hypothetical protein
MPQPAVYNRYNQRGSSDRKVRLFETITYCYVFICMRGALKVMPIYFHRNYNRYRMHNNAAA